MKILIVYYSHYGNTAFVIERVSDALRQIGKVDIFQLEYLGATPSLLKRTLFRLFPSFVKLAPVPFDASGYDLLCLGIPVWGGRPSGAMAKYIHMCKNIDEKKVICCFVFGIEASAKSCFEYVKRALMKKGNPKLLPLYIPWAKAHEEKFLLERIQQAMQQINP